MHYQWLLFLDDVQLHVKIIHECPWWELQMLQLRFLLFEYIDCSKWQRCSWRLEMGDREVLSHANRPSIMRPWMKKDVTATPKKFTIFLHNEKVMGEQFCSSELSFCIPMPLLFAQLQDSEPTPKLRAEDDDPKPLSRSLCDIRGANEKDQRVLPASRMPKSPAVSKPLNIPAAQLGASVSSLTTTAAPMTQASRPKISHAVRFPLVHGTPPSTPGAPELPSCPGDSASSSDSVCVIL